MQRLTHYILPLLALCLPLLTSCEGTTFRSSVPSYPVNIRINTQLGMYVTFTSVQDYIIVDRNGYHFRNQTLPRTDADAYGYAGVVIYITYDMQYAAFDLCCPHCLRANAPVEVDGLFAICPTCGEQYDLYNGIGNPTSEERISNESLRRYSLIVSGGVITVYN